LTGTLTRDLSRLRDWSIIVVINLIGQRGLRFSVKILGSHEKNSAIGCETYSGKRESQYE
jgi:hypothetical protein